jgi:Zn-dependent metalloprotease
VRAQLTPLPLKQAEEMAREYIATNSQLFADRDPNANLSLEQCLRANGDCHLRFRQTYAGQTVENAWLTLHVNEAGVYGFENDLDQTVLNAEVTRGGFAQDISMEKAQSIAEADLQSTNLRAPIKVEPVVSSRSGKAGLAWQVQIPSGKPLGDFQYLVSAETGKILDVTDYMNQFETTGKAYITNPIRSKVTSIPLTDLDGSGNLIGSWVKVINEDVAGAHETDGTFDYEVGNTHFEEVMAYLHMTIVHNFFKNKYDFDKLDYSFPIYVHYGDNYDNAFYSPWQGIIALGDGSKLNNLAREAGVIYHEYTHVVTGKIANMRGGEAGAMNESFSDYFACTITEDPDIGEWAMAKLNRPYMRTMVNNSHYPEDVQNEVHRDSVMYSAPLWKIRKALGAEKADKIIHFSRYYMPSSNAKFSDGVLATIAADRKYYNGKNEEVIRKAFAEHGIKAKTSETVSEFTQLLKTRMLDNDQQAKELYNSLNN